MSRTVSQTLLDAIQNQQGETILRVKTWLNLAAYNAAPTVPEQTWQTNKFKIEGTEAEAALISETNDYTVSDFTVFLIERGVSISGVEYVTQSGLYFVSKFEEKAGRINIKGSSFPDQKIVIDGDDTYENVITAFCTEIGKTAVFKDTGAAWLSYQFLPPGKQVILNKAERFLNLIRQKYLIQCYERSPKELVFYHATTEQSAWKDIIYNDSTLILAASSGSHEIARSADGLAYTKTDAPHFTNAVAYSPALDLFVAVGDGVAMSSPDGVTWTTRTIGTGNFLSVSWDESISKFVAIATSTISYSANGTTWTTTEYTSTWTARTVASAISYSRVCWSPELKLFIAVGTNSANFASSPNGITWTNRTAPASQIWRDVCWSPELSLFVAVSADGTNRVATSPDGITWTARSAAEANTWNAVCWSPELSLFVAVASGGTNRVMTSPDGITWTARSAAEANTWWSVCWSPELSLFVAVAWNGTNRVMTSPDGITWTARSAAEANTWMSVCWSPELSLFVAVANDGTNRVMTSSNGTAWTARSASEVTAWYGVCWSPELSLFVAVSSSTGTRAMTSPDGINWTDSSIQSYDFFGICWSPDLMLFCAVGNSAISTLGVNLGLLSVTSNNGKFVAIGTKCISSNDGLSWYFQTIPAGTYNKIIYADSLFVAVGASKCATSPDGITWTERTILAGTYTALAYSPTLDLFLAMGDNLAATSPDGITWTSRTAPADQAWQAVTWADDLAQFIAVSSDGDNRIASSTDGINWQILTAQADYSLSYLDGPTSSILHGTNTVHYISRDESSAVNTEGDTSYPAWNLGYLESTASAPATNTDPFYKFFLQKAPLRLDITDGDRIHFEPSWTLDPTLPIDAMVTIIEIFDSTKSPAWYQEIRSLALFDSVEGGSLPSTIERVAAYTPLVSSGFDGNLTPEVNNLQALAEAVDNLVTSGGYTPPATTAVNDFQVGDGAGAWVKKTLAQVITILGIFADAASDSIYYARRNGGWTNLKTYTDTLYSLLGHVHAASDITSGTMATARLGSGTADSSKRLAGDSTWVNAPSADSNSEALYRCNTAYASGWTGTINGAPSGANVTVTTSTGNIASVTPSASTHLAKMRLFNTTRGNYALIQSVSGSVITLTATAPGTWANGDALTVISTTVSSGDGRNWCEFEITSGVTKDHIFIDVAWTNTTAGKQCGAAPIESFSFNKAFFLTSPGQATVECQPLKIYNGSYRAFSLSWQDAGTNIIAKYKGYLR